jgi:hypothetical protein
MQAGDTFLLGGGHLWIVLSDPSAHAGCFVFANLTSDYLRAGTHCELNSGDHPWVKKKCYVNFGDAYEVTPVEEARMAAFITSGAITRHVPLGPAILQKIVAAAKTSKALPKILKKYFP